VNNDLISTEIGNEFFEGEIKARLSNYYERNPKLHIAAIKIHGLVCKVCDFKAFYGEHGTGFIEVHHLKQVSTLQPATKVDAKKDMTVVCSNCHRMLHRSKDKTSTPAELKRLLK
jgi:5-methylcytosine-specific restriction protein A